MNAELLLAHFSRINDAPDAVPRLRRFILDLAVRGKLVEQDPNDEPVVALLNRIRREKVKLIERGNARKQKPLVPLDMEEISFLIPVSWQWSQLAEIGFINPRNSAEDRDQASFVQMSSISAEYGIANAHEVRPWGDIKSGFTHFAEGDVALAKITPCFENGKSTVFRNLEGGIGAGTTELHVVRPVFVSADYILIFLKSPYFIESGIPKMTGTAGQKRVSTECFANSPFPLPPKEEQRRIVAKVDELMALCNRLEAAQRERESRRDQLTAATHHHLSNGADAKITRGYAQFFIGHLPHLTARPNQIKQLRQTILNFAVRGKLVPQDPSAEPAFRVLERNAQSNKLAMHTKRKERVDETNTSGCEQLFDLPQGWAWAQFQRLTSQSSVGIDRGRSLQGPAKAYAYFKMNNIRNSGGLEMSALTRIDASNDEVEIFALSDGDFLFNTRNSRELVGKTCVFRAWSSDPVLYNNNILRVRFIHDFAPDFFDFWFRSSHGKAELEKLKSNTTNVCAIYQGKLADLPCPVPPLAEQHRIVVKLDELMALCDHLEARLTTAQSEASHLLESVLYNALNAKASY